MNFYHGRPSESIASVISLPGATKLEKAITTLPTDYIKPKDLRNPERKHRNIDLEEKIAIMILKTTFDRVQLNGILSIPRKNKIYTSWKILHHKLGTTNVFIKYIRLSIIYCSTNVSEMQTVKLLKNIGELTMTQNLYEKKVHR